MPESTQCHYHQEPAVWACSGCLKQYGSCCVPKPPEHLDLPLCILCSQELKYLGEVSSIKPFWARINDFFLYPLRVSSLGFLATCSLLTILISYFGSMALPLIIIIPCVMTKYSLQIIDRMSEGDWQPPTIVEGFSGDGFSLFFRQMGIFILMGVMLYFVEKLNSAILLIAAGAFFLLAIPASMMILARERSAFSAVNPARLVSVIFSIGWPYLLLYFFLIILYGAPGYFLGGQQQEMEPNGFVMAASLFVSGYFSYVMCSMMGYCLFQFQESLGYDAEMDEAEEFTEEEYLLNKALLDSNVLVREGRENQALDILARTLSQNPEHLELNQRYHRLLLLVGGDAPLLAFTQKYLRRLLILRKDYDAAEVYLSVRRKVPSYKPDDPGDRYRLAQALSRKGDTRRAIQLVLNMHREFPRYKQLPDAYYLAARLFSESLGDDVKAEQLLNYIIRQFPHSAAAVEARTLKSVIDAIA